MSYVVLARKYRPQTFEEIVGQEHVTRTLASAIARGRVHHAFLFCGARGVGKTTAARILAKCLSCEQAPTPTPCNQCDSCKEITAGTAVDVQEIDGASNNSVEDVRTLREGVRYLPVRGKKKVYIIDEVHMLSTGAFNALLKTLEEPPPHAVFVFATTEVHKIPITILSRVQRYDFRLVAAPRIAQHLAKVLDDEGIAYDPGALQVVAREAGGSVRDALSLLEQVLAVGAAGAGPTDDGEAPAVCSEQAAAEALGVADRGLVTELGQAVLARDGARALELVAAAVERNVDLKHLAQVFLEHLRDLVVCRVVPDPSSLVEVSEGALTELKQVAARAPNGLLPLLFDRTARLCDEVARSSLPRFVLEVGFIELCQVEPLEPIGELVDRLEALELRLGSGATPARPRVEAAPAPAQPAPPRAPSASPRSAQPTPAARQPASPVTPTRAPAQPAAAPMKASAPVPAQPVAAPMKTSAAGPRPTSWNELSEQLAARRPSLVGVLYDGEEVEFSPSRVVVAFPNAFLVRQAKDKLDDITRLAREILGAPVTVEICEGHGRAPSTQQAEAQRLSDERAERRREALEHPARKLITRAFGDDVVFKEPIMEPELEK